MNTKDFKRRLAAILSADVEGYSRLMGEDEDATIRTLTSYRELISTLIQKHWGRVVDSPGDNLLAEFSSVVDAVRCAVEIQEDLRVRNAELFENRRMRFRIGINLGDVINEEGRIYGDGINIAARVEGLSIAGGICISGSVYDQVKNKISLEYDFLGDHSVKNISDPIRVYRVLLTTDDINLYSIGMKKGEPGQTVSSTAEKPSIAVLPFENMSGESQQEYLSDGITENIITALAKIPEMLVIARNSVFTLKGKPIKVQQVAQELGVNYVLEGSIMMARNRIRITAQLIDAIKGYHLWAES